MWNSLVLWIAAALALAQADDANELADIADLEKRFVDARSYYEEGVIAHDEGSMNDALPFYRAAVRLHPESIEYLLRLGNTEYQLGLLEQATRRFQGVLNMDPKSSSAKYFIKMIDAKQHKQIHSVCMDGDCEEDAGADSVAQPVLPAKELPVSVLESTGGATFYFPSFVEHSRRPFVIRGAMQHVGCNLTVFAPESFNVTYSSHLVDFYPQNMMTKPTKVYTVPFSKALDYLAYPEGAYFSVDTSDPGTYIQWNMNETTWDALLDSAGLLTSLPAVLTHSLDSLLSPTADTVVSTDGSIEAVEQTPETVVDMASVKHSFGHKTHWYMVLVGEKGSGMFGHTDTLAVGSWQAQVAGSKRWTLCAPSGISTVKSKDCYEATLQTGDLIYYPPYYWHETMNLETPTVSLSATVVVDAPVVVVPTAASATLEQPADFRDQHTTYREELVAMLQEECRSNKKGFSFDVTFCEVMGVSFMRV